MGMVLTNYSPPSNGYTAKVYPSAYAYTVTGGQDFRGPLRKASPSPLAAVQGIDIYESKESFTAGDAPIYQDSVNYTSQADLFACITGNFPEWTVPVETSTSQPIKIGSLKYLAAFCLRNHPVYGQGVWD